MIDDAPLTVPDVVAIAGGSSVEVGPAAQRRIVASRAVVDSLVHGDALVYGLNTGLGHMRDERVPLEGLERAQVETVRLHAGGIGPPLPEAIVRAAMAVRLAGIARGGSGASPDMAATLAAMLNARITPVVPSVGSVGASDLMHMAAIALVAIGEGEAVVAGARLPGGEALAQAGIPPLRLAPKDGLTMISANGVSIGHGALVVDRAMRLARAADVVAALSLEAAAGNPSIVERAAAAAKPVPGQAAAAERIRGLLEGNDDRVTPRSVQDPLAFRVIPQVHGALREVVAFASEAVELELAAMDDNPLVSIAEQRMISNGNFHPMLMTLAIDALRPALAHTGQLSDRRAGHVWEVMISNPEVFEPDARERLGVAPLVRYAGAARTAELRSIVDPVSLDVGVLDFGVEDHATNAPLAVRRTDEALDLLADVLACELLLASASIAWLPETRTRIAPRVRPVFEAVEDAVAAAGSSASSERVHAAVRALLADPLFVE